MTKLIFELSQPCSEVEEDNMKTFPEIGTMETDHELHISNEEQFDFRRKSHCFVLWFQSLKNIVYSIRVKLIVINHNRL